MTDGAAGGGGGIAAAAPAPVLASTQVADARRKVDKMGQRMMKVCLFGALARREESAVTVSLLCAVPQVLSRLL